MKIHVPERFLYYCTNEQMLTVHATNGRFRCLGCNYQPHPANLAAIYATLDLDGVEVSLPKELRL